MINRTFTILKGKDDNESKNEITILVFWLTIIASLITLYLGVRHIVDLDEYGRLWGQFAILQAFFGIAGYLGKQITDGQPIKPRKFKEINRSDTMMHTAIIFITSMVTQVITQYVFAINTTEQALFYVFAAVCEEVFFRMFLISIITRKNKTILMKIVAIIVQSLIFALFHQNYWSTPAMLFGVFIGGIILGVFYVVWNDITANILAHFILNFVAVLNWLVVL